MSVLFKEKIMIYQIDTRFYENCQRTYYADSFKEAYEMFRKLGTKLIRTDPLITSKMYERKQGEMRYGVYYCGSNQIAKTIEISMKPYQGNQEVQVVLPSDALEDLHWAIFSRDMVECIPGVNDMKFHYGDKYKR